MPEQQQQQRRPQRRTRAQVTSHGRGVSPDRSGAQKSEITACCAPLQSWAGLLPLPQLPGPGFRGLRPRHPRSAARFAWPPSASVCPPPLTETPAARLRAHPSPGPSPLKSLSADPISDILKFGVDGKQGTSVPNISGLHRREGASSRDSQPAQ